MKISSAILTTMSGKLGGAVAATARGGVKYMRALVQPSNPRSQQQTAVRAILSSLAAAWRGTLTTPQRSAWAALADDEESGIDVYIKCNVQQLLAGDASVPAAPTTPTLTFTPYTSIVMDASAHTIVVPSAPGLDLQKINVYATAPQSVSRLSRQFPYRLVGTILSDGTSVAVPASHPAYDVTAGQIVYVKMIPFGLTGEVTAGQVGQAFEFRQTVVA